MDVEQERSIIGERLTALWNTRRGHERVYDLSRKVKISPTSIFNLFAGRETHKCVTAGTLFVLFDELGGAIDIVARNGTSWRNLSMTLEDLHEAGARFSFPPSL
jgi:hypothetical protein